jgi:hypothetical protein
MNTLRFFCTVLLSAIFLTGCLSPTLPQKPITDVVYFTPQGLKSADFAQEIAKLLVITQDPETSAMEKAEAHRRLAILYLVPGNPDGDFRRAVDELGKFLESAPEKLDRPAAACWATALKSGEEFQDMKKQSQNLKTKVVRLDVNNRQLSKEKTDLKAANSELKQTIEKLKKLDLSLEKKRRDFR